MIIAQSENPTPLVIMAGGKEVLRIERDHTVLHGQRVDDAGEAHRALVGALLQVAPGGVSASILADAARLEWLANHGGCPFAETDPAWDTPERFRKELDEAIAHEKK